MKVFKITLKGVCKAGMYIIAAPDIKTAQEVFEKYFFIENDHYDWAYDCLKDDEDVWHAINVQFDPVEELKTLSCLESTPRVIAGMDYFE